MNYDSLVDPAAAETIAVNRAPSDMNGGIGTLDLANPATFVDKANRWVVGVGGCLDLARTIAYYISPKNGDLKGIPTSASIKSALLRVGNTICVYEVMALCSKANIAMSIRATDSMTEQQFAAEYADAAAATAALNTAHRLYATLKSNVEYIAAATVNSNNVLLALVACAAHRIENPDHNWYTDRADKKGTTTAKLLKVAADEQDEFRAFMAEYGHDLWHPITTVCLDKMALALTDRTAGVLTASVRYKGIEYKQGAEGSNVASIVKIGQAAADRYPPGYIGTSALHVGLAAVCAMVLSIASKVTLKCAGDLVNAIKDLEVNTIGSLTTRDQLMDMKARLSYVISVAYGFCARTRALNDVIEGKEALASLARNNVAATTFGNTLADRIVEMNADPVAVSAAITTALLSIAVAIADAGKGNAVPIDADIDTTTAVKARAEAHAAKTNIRLSSVTAMEKLSVVSASGIAYKDLEELDA